MPNWCMNSISISGNPSTINAFHKYLETEGHHGWFTFFYPMPESVIMDDAYNWHCENWGTKWDAYAQDWVVEEDDGSAVIHFSFESAWAPPLALYSYMERAYGDISVYASYWEPGMSFTGYYREGMNDHYEVTEESMDEIPVDLLEEWGITLDEEY